MNDNNKANSGIIWFVTITAALLSALYLTFLVDTYTLNTVSKRVFVFCYFLVMCLTAVFLRRKLTKEKAQRKGALAAAGILAALIIVLGHSVFFPSAKETTVSLSALPCEDESYHEVWFTSLQVDGREAQLSNLEVDAIQGWIYDRGGDDYVYYPGEDNGENYLTFKVTGQAVNLYFGQNAWSGIVNIWVDGTAGDTLLLTSEDNSSVDYTVNAVRHYAAWEYILYGLGAWVTVAYFLLLLLSLGYWKNDFKHKGNRVTWVLLGTIGIVIVWRIGFSQILQPYILYPDSYGYMNYPWNDFFHLNLVSGRTPVYPAFLALIRLFCGDSGYLSVVPVVQSVISIVSLLFLFRLLWALTRNDLIAGIVTTGYGVCPDIIIWDYSILTESIALSLTIIFVFLLVSFLKEPRYTTGLKAIILSGLMIFERPTFLLFAVILFCFWILRMIAYKQERAMLLRLCAASLCTFLLVGLYSIGMHKNFGIYSISDAMPRQNVVTAINRGYYTESSNIEFSELVSRTLAENDGDVWTTVGAVLNKYGLSESNRLAKEVLFKDMPRYIKDTVEQMITDSRYYFSEGTINLTLFISVDSGSFQFLAIRELQQELQIRILYLYVGWLLCLCMLVVAWIKERRIPWLYIGLATFMAAIPITTYIATCGEFGRTMIHVIPFIYITFAMAIDVFVRASKVMSLD